MTPEDLQSWLLSDAIRDDLRLISAGIAALEFQSESNGISERYADIDWRRLLLAGSILARSTERATEEAALRIATAAVLLSDESSIRDSGAILLEKLSNNRAVELAEARELVRPGLLSRLGVAARVEATRRMIEQSVLEEATGKWLVVNSFQAALWKEASSVSVDWLSASAPTASGKTYLVRRWLMNELIAGSKNRVAIYIAPTRALVSEIEACFKATIRELDGAGSVEISSLPVRKTYEAGISGKSKALFVFTQERLHLLANAVGGKLRVDILVVDEAHKIGDGGRGVILQAAIERVADANPKLRVVFVSPATQNPEVLLQDAPVEATRKAIDSDLPTVLQNILYCTQASGASTKWELRLRLGSELLPVGVLKLPFRPTNVRKKIAFVAAAAGSKGGTLVYANGAAEAEKIAILIAQTVPKLSDENSELAGLAELARKGVHPDYQLANVVENGVAFHYGNMPSLLRLEIERLFREGALRFLVCTSTLIEGVNLSCRTIVVRGPRRGKGRPMDAPDFWNLAGRAGRWGNEFQGNIICIDPYDLKLWPSGVPDRARYPILRETDSVINRVTELEVFIGSRDQANEKMLAASAELEQVTSYLLSTYMQLGSIENAPFAKRHDVQYVARLNRLLAELMKGVHIGADLVARHPGVSAVGMQKLLDALRFARGREETLVPEPPESEGAYARLCDIMRTINQTLYPAFMPDSLVPLHALIVIEWLRGYSLSYIIRKRIAYHRKHGKPVKIAEVIRTTMEMVEQIARFRAPKYLAAYIDVLRVILNENGRADLLGDDIDIGLALEFGVSTKTLLSLMEFGLSRMSAVALNEVIANDQLGQEDCVNWLRSNRKLLTGSDMPILILKEIDDVMNEYLI